MAQLPTKKPKGFQKDANTLKRVVKSNPKDLIEVEVGDSKQPDFKPQFKLMRWANEVNFSMRAQEHPDATVAIDGDVIKYVTPEYEVHQYEKPVDGEDGFEFEWVLPKKPESNVLTATIQTKELNFFYQPPLTPEEVAEGSQRPENVVGSYAVYHKTKGGMNRADGMEYKTGKAFHIYRPEAVDANGQRTWCDLDINEGKGELTATVPESFLESASYPVVVDPTFGYTTVGGSTLGARSNTSTKIGSVHNPLTAVTGDTITSYSFYGVVGSGTGPNEMTAYTETSGHPDARLALATSISSSTSPGWKTSATVSQSLTNGVKYNIAWGTASLPGGVNAAINYDEGTVPGRFSSTSAAMTDPFAHTGTDSGRRYSMYATYTADGGSSPSSSPSASPSSSPSSSISASPSSSPSSSISSSPSSSISSSPSPSSSISSSPSSSVSSSPSSSISASPSSSESSSISSSPSPSSSISSSPSSSISSSPSSSESSSISSSPSPSSSISSSPSSSTSSSESASISASPSSSSSSSVSASPSSSPSSSAYGGVLKRWNGSTWVKAELNIYLN